MVTLGSLGLSLWLLLCTNCRLSHICLSSQDRLLGLGSKRIMAPIQSGVQSEFEVGLHNLENVPKSKEGLGQTVHWSLWL